MPGIRPKKAKVRMVGRGDGLLIGLAPEAFEAWVGERFRDLGYEVHVTPFQGDLGVDLILSRDDEKVIVQCKHHPLSTIGEPVLRDRFGAHHVGATSAALITTGQLSTAARQWLIGKPIQVWGCTAPSNKNGVLHWRF
jgi:restriction system protein